MVLKYATLGWRLQINPPTMHSIFKVDMSSPIRNIILQLRSEAKFRKCWTRNIYGCYFYFHFFFISCKLRISNCSAYPSPPHLLHIDFTDSKHLGSSCFVCLCYCVAFITWYKAILQLRMTRLRYCYSSQQLPVIQVFIEERHDKCTYQIK